MISFTILFGISRDYSENLQKTYNLFHYFFRISIGLIRGYSGLFENIHYSTVKGFDKKRFESNFLKSEFNTIIIYKKKREQFNFKLLNFMWAFFVRETLNGSYNFSQRGIKMKL